MMMIRGAFPLLLLSLSLLAGPALADDPEKIGSFKDWEAYSYKADDSKVCFAFAKPKKSEASRKAAGAIWLDILQSPARKNHFTTLEGWSTRATFDAQALSAHAREFREKLGPMLGALYDQRLFKIVE